MLALVLYCKVGRQDIPLGKAKQLNSAPTLFNPSFKNSFLAA